MILGLERASLIFGCILCLSATTYAEIQIYAQGYDSDWDAVERILAKSAPECGNIEVTNSMDPFDSLISKLRSGAIQGVIVSPYRYVLIHDAIDDIQTIARIRRGGTSMVKQGQCNSEALKDLSADSYSSIVLTSIARQENSYPFDPERIPHLRVPSALSTSGFLYPAAYLNEIAGDNAQITDPCGRDIARESVLSQAANQGRSICDKRVSLDDLLQELASPTGEFDLLGTNTHQFQTWAGLDASEQSRYREVWRSPPIPFDAVVLSSQVNEECRLSIQSSLLSTQYVIDQVRDLTAPPTEVATVGHRGDDPVVRCERVPDIHSFIAAAESDYDNVRRAAVSVAGGPSIRLGISRHAHRDWPRDKPFFERVKRCLLSRDDGGIPAFLDYSLYETESFANLRTFLESGELDVVELSAFESGQVVAERSGVVLASAQYLDETLTGELKSGETHRLLLLSAGKEHSVDEFLNDSSKIAVASRETASAYGFFRSYGVENLEGLNSHRVIEVPGYHGVYDALRRWGRTSGQNDIPNDEEDRPAAKYGVMAEYEWIQLRDHASRDGIRRIRQFVVPVPNLALVASGAFAPFDEHHRPFRFDWANPLAGLAKKPSTRLGDRERIGRVRDVEKVQKCLVSAGDSRSETNGFVSFNPESAFLTADTVRDSYRRSVPAQLPLFLASVICIIISSALIILVASRRRKDPPLQRVRRFEFGPERQTGRFIWNAISIRDYLRDAELQGKKTPLREALGKNFDGASQSLDDAIVTTLAFHDRDERLVDAEKYFQALSELAAQVRMIVEPIARYEEEHQRGIPKDRRLDLGDPAQNPTSVPLREVLELATQILRSVEK